MQQASFKLILFATAIFLLSFNNKLQSQTAATFMMSSMGALPNTANAGAAIQFNSIATCLNVQNGIAVLNGERANGQFAINCEVTLKINSLGVKMYPNPVNATTKVKFINTPPLTEVFNLSIWTSEGVLIQTKKETGYNLFQGLTLDVSGLTSGTFILKIESNNFVDALKFIKAN